jgi:hypothetical protein
VLVQNEFDKLSSFEAGGPSYLETVLRVIEDEAWNPLRLPSMLNDQIGALLQGSSLQSTALGNGADGHCYLLLSSRNMIPLEFSPKHSESFPGYLRAERLAFYRDLIKMGFPFPTCNSHFLKVSMSEERDCVVKFVDCHDVEHSVKVRASSVYEARIEGTRKQKLRAIIK